MAVDTDACEDERHRFVDAVGVFFARYALTPTFGRVFGLLLISDDPLSLGEIAQWLHTSKRGANVAARDLERVGLVRRHLTRGSRRILYDASDDMLPIFEAQFMRCTTSHSPRVLGWRNARHSDECAPRDPTPIRARCSPPVRSYASSRAAEVDRRTPWRRHVYPSNPAATIAKRVATLQVLA